MSTMRYIAVAVAIMLALSITYYAYYRANATNNAIGIDGKLYIYKNGKLVHSGADLLTNNFYNYLIALLEENFFGNCNQAPSSVFTYTPTISSSTDIAGSSYSCNTIYPSAATNNVYIGLGTSNGAPTRADTNLNSKLVTQVATSTYVSTNPAYVNYTASYSASSSVTIGEVSLYWFFTVSGVTNYYTMVAHDSVSISMQAGDVIAVTYQLKDATSSNSKFFALLYQCTARALPSTNAYTSGSTQLCINGGGTMQGCPISYASTSTGSSTTCNSVQISYANGKATFLGTTLNTISSVNQLQYAIYIGATFFIPITLSFSSVNLVQGQLAGFQISGG